MQRHQLVKLKRRRLKLLLSEECSSWAEGGKWCDQWNTNPVTRCFDCAPLRLMLIVVQCTVISARVLEIHFISDRVQRCI